MHNARRRIVEVDDAGSGRPLPRTDRPDPNAVETSADQSSLSEADLDQLVAQARLRLVAHLSLPAYLRLRNLPLIASPAVVGQELARLCRLRRRAVRKVPDPRISFINAYPLDILDEYFQIS